jgi:uncharacterized membrane protein
MARNKNKKPRNRGLSQQAQQRAVAQQGKPGSETTHTTLLSTTSFRIGPLPSPEELSQYDAIDPGTAKLLIQQALKQTEHRIAMESTVIRGENRRAYLGLVSALIIALAGFGLAYAFVLNGKTLEALVLSGLDITALASIFVYGTNSRRQERQYKDRRARE